MHGTLIFESLRVGTRLDDCNLTVRAIRRFATHDLPAYQPPIWTVVDFEADAQDHGRTLGVPEPQLDWTE